MCIFFIKHITAFLHLGTLAITSAPHLGAILSSHQQKTQNVKNMTPSRLWKEHLFIVWELKQVGRELTSLTSVENICLHVAAEIFCLLMPLCDWPQKWHNTDLGITNLAGRQMHKYEICE